MPRGWRDGGQRVNAMKPLSVPHDAGKDEACLAVRRLGVWRAIDLDHRTHPALLVLTTLARDDSPNLDRAASPTRKRARPFPRSRRALPLLRPVQHGYQSPADRAGQCRDARGLRRTARANFYAASDLSVQGILRRRRRHEAKDSAAEETGDGAAIRVVALEDGPWRYCQPHVAGANLPTVVDLPSLHRSAIGN